MAYFAEHLPLSLQHTHSSRPPCSCRLDDQPAQHMHRPKPIMVGLAPHAQRVERLTSAHICRHNVKPHQTTKSGSQSTPFQHLLEGCKQGKECSTSSHVSHQPQLQQHRENTESTLLSTRHPYSRDQPNRKTLSL